MKKILSKNCAENLMQSLSIQDKVNRFSFMLYLKLPKLKQKNALNNSFQDNGLQAMRKIIPDRLETNEVKSSKYTSSMQ